MKEINEKQESGHVGGRESVLLFLCLTSLLVLVPLSIASAGTSVSGTYFTTFDPGDGTSFTSDTYALSTSPTAPLAYSQSSSNGGSSASARAGLWGSGYPDAYWGMWLTEGTGVSQSDPDNAYSSPAALTLAFDILISGTTYSSWIDYWYLAGTVGADGHVGFNAAVDMYLYTEAAGVEVYQNSVQYSYYNDTVGSFWIYTGAQDPLPVVDIVALQEGDYLRLSGSYTYYAKNDGDPSSIYFTETAPPVQTPEPETILLSALGLAGLAAIGRRMCK